MALFITLLLYFGVSNFLKTDSSNFQRDTKISQHPATLDATVTSKYTERGTSVGANWTINYYVQYTWYLNGTAYSDTQELASDYGAYLAIKSTIPLKYDSQDPRYHTVNKLVLPTTTNRTTTIVIVGLFGIVLGGMDAVIIGALIRALRNLPN